MKCTLGSGAGFLMSSSGITAVGGATVKPTTS
jgi:hypothetical protein